MAVKKKRKRKGTDKSTAKRSTPKKGPVKSTAFLSHPQPPITSAIKGRGRSNPPGDSLGSANSTIVVNPGGGGGRGK